MNRRSRRRFLETLGGSWLLATAPLVRRLAAAAVGPAPRRFVAVLLPNSVEQRLWIPEGGLDVATGAGDASGFRLNLAGKPLEAVRAHLTLVDGINIPGTSGELHGSGCIGFTTGEATSEDRQLAVRPSIDQYLAARSPLLRGTTFPSLPVACDTRADLANLGPRFRAMSFDANGGAIVGENSPHDTYVRLFARLAAPGATDAERRAALERTRAANASVLDFVRGSLEGLKRRVPAADRARLDQHLEGIRELERTLTTLPPAQPAPSGGTATTPTLDAAALKSLVANDSKSHAKIVDAYFAIVKLAFQLDLTRVSSVMLAAVQNNVDFSLVEPGYPEGRVHRMSHEVGKYRDAMLKVTNWYCQRLAAFVDALAQTAEGDGTRMIANTVVLLFSECTIIGNDPHRHQNVPVALFGGSALGLRGNRCLRYGGRNSNELMVPLVRAFGVQTDVFGKATFSSRPLTGLI